MLEQAILNDPSQRGFRGRTFPQTGWALAICAALLAAGCEQSGSDTGTDVKTVSISGLTAAAIWSKVKEKYRETNAYADSAELFYQGTANGQLNRGPKYPCAIALERPNRVRVAANGAALVCDGNTVRAAIFGNDGQMSIPDQVLQLPAITTARYELLSCDALLRDAIGGALGQPFMPQLALLVGEMLPGNLQNDAPVETGHVASQQCYLLTFEAPQTKYTYWIDSEQFILRRVDIVSERVQEQIDPDRQLSNFITRIELDGATFDQPLPAAAFAFETPKSATAVRRFVMPNPPLPKRLGEVVSSFQFADLEGKVVDRQSLGDKLLVLDFWFTGCEPCRESFPFSERLYQAFREDSRVEFLAVSVDPESVDSSTIESTLREWGATMPVVRDKEHFWSTSFELQGTPSLVVLDGRNRIQAFHDGPLTDIADLQRVIERVAEGEDVAQTQIARHATLQREFELELTRASVQSSTELVEVLQAKIAPRAEPKRLEMKQIARYEGLQSPGNLLIYLAEQGPQALVLEEAAAAVAIDSEGQTLARHPLEAAIRVSHLRSAQRSDGERLFLATASGRPHAYLFDSKWKLLLKHPVEERLSVGDALIEDLDSDGQPEIVVGYWEIAGLHCLDLDGKMRWTNRAVENVRCVATAGPNAEGEKQLLAVGTSGTVLVLDAEGKQQNEWQIANRAVLCAATADLDGDSTREICVLLVEAGKDSQVEAAGLSPTGEELWRYRLPDGFPNPLIERIVPVKIPGDIGGWLFPAADGSIHFVNMKGELIDSLQYGAELTGLAMMVEKDRTVLLIATAEGLTSWSIAPK